MRPGVERTIDRAIHAIVVLVLLVAADRPGSVVRRWVDEWRLEAVRKSYLETAWGDLSESNGSGVPTIVEFMDYECPYCRMIHDSIARAVSEGRVQVIYRHLPLPNHDRAEEAALVAICAEQTGDFPTAHDWLMRDDGWASGPRLMENEELLAFVTHPSGLESCLARGEATDRLALDIGFARELRLRGTPSFVGRYGVEEGVRTIDSLLTLTKSSRR